MVDSAAFELFLASTELRLRVALTAAYGPVDGRIATFEALSWAWEHWPKVREMANPVGYLFRVGRTAARRVRSRPFPVEPRPPDDVERAFLDPELLTALSGLSEQQRLIVLLVHAFGWTIRETAEALSLRPSTVQTHAERGVARLRSHLGGT